MTQLENIEAIERRLWSAADTLRSNSSYASNEYFMPVMGLIFLRHAYSRFLAVKETIKLPSRGGKTRELTKEDFSQKSAIFLRPEAQFDYLVSLTDSDDRAQKIIDAMESIEADYESLSGSLPKAEYQELDNQVLGVLLRTLNPKELQKASGDIFGRIYEYFLTQFADVGAHDNGEFFTPVSLIANVLEPERGIVLDPACGSGGMFVQGARFLEQLQNLLSIVWLYRGEGDRFLELVKGYLAQTLAAGQECFSLTRPDEATQPLADYTTSLLKIQETTRPFIKSLAAGVSDTEVFTEFRGAAASLDADIKAFHQRIEHEQKTWEKEPAITNADLNAATERLTPLATTSRDLVKQADLAYKLATRLVDHCEQELEAKESDLWVNREMTKARKDADAARQVAVEQLKQVRYFHKQAVWLTERFPDGTLRDVEGLVALVDRETIEKNDWSLTPGRYVGVAPEEVDEDFDFEETLRDIHVELEGLNQEAVELAAKIAQNFRELGI